MIHDRSKPVSYAASAVMDTTPEGSLKDRISTMKGKLKNKNKVNGRLFGQMLGTLLFVTGSHYCLLR